MSQHDFYAAELSQIPVRGHRTFVGDVETAWWEFGHRGSGVDVVMVHGFRGDHHGLQPLVASLGADVHVVIPDLPGFGDSGAFSHITPAASPRLDQTPSAIDPYAAWLQQFLHTIGADDDTVVLGHSFGSIVVAAAFARGLTQRRCALINPIATNALAGPRGILTRLAVLYYRAAAALPNALGQGLLRNRAIVRMMSVTMSKTRDRQLRRWIHGQHDSYFSSFASRESVLHAFTASIEHDVSEFANSLPTGTLLIAAAKDDITSVDKQRELAAKVPESTLVIIPDVGHLVHYETPAAAADALRTYMGLTPNP